VPDLLSRYANPFPSRRPVGLRRRHLGAGTELWRIDAVAPPHWSWEGFPVPRNRFDPASGGFRARYAGRSLVGAARERYRASGLFVPADHAGQRLVQLVATRDLRAFDLRAQRNLDVLGVDDQISTGQHPAVWDACHRLVDAARTWWDDLDAIIYRSRTTPATSVNVAFFATGAFRAQSWALAERGDIVTDLVLRHGFTVDWELHAGGPTSSKHCGLP
jgi:RES domain